MISVVRYNQRYCTGLQVTRDPGVWVVPSGFILMIVGFFTTFFMPHKRAFIEVEKQAGGCRISVFALPTKKGLDMKNQINKLCQRLKSYK